MLRPKILPIAHRGGNTVFPENTVEAFLRAKQLGYECIETDVQLSLDGVVYVFHDFNFKRLFGVDKVLSKTSSSEIDELLLNGKYHIPRLKDVLNQFPDLIFNIDAKSWSVVEPLVSTIKEADATSRVYIASFNDRRVRSIFHLLSGKVKTVGGTSQVIKFILGFLTGIKFSFSANFLQLPEKRFGIYLVSERSINYAKRVGMKMHVWTINDEDKMISLIQMGVDGIMTDECEKLKSVLAKHV